MCTPWGAHVFCARVKAGLGVFWELFRTFHLVYTRQGEFNVFPGTETALSVVIQTLSVTTALLSCVTWAVCLPSLRNG